MANVASGTLEAEQNPVGDSESCAESDNKPIYNLFHTSDLTPAQVAKVSKKSLPEAEVGYQDILELRRLHRELDFAIRDAYLRLFMQHHLHRSRSARNRGHASAKSPVTMARNTQSEVL